MVLCVCVWSRVSTHSKNEIARISVIHYLLKEYTTVS
jgi:hypothetical protein